MHVLCQAACQLNKPVIQVIEQAAEQAGVIQPDAIARDIYADWGHRIEVPEYVLEFCNRLLNGDNQLLMCA